MSARLPARWILGLVIMACCGTATLHAGDVAWNLVAELSPDANDADGYFGEAVAVTPDFAFVGSHITGSGSGNMYVYDLGEAMPVRSARVRLCSGNCALGKSVAADGQRFVVASGGPVVLFEHESASWNRVSLPLIQDPNFPGDEHQAGNGSYAISGDWIVVGDRRADLGSREYAGAAFLYRNRPQGWRLRGGALYASDAAWGDAFGDAVGIDGNTIVVGAPNRSRTAAQVGGAYVFEFDGTEWIEAAILEASDGAPYDQFGDAVGVSGDRIIVGAPYDINENGVEAGAVYVFERTGGTWTEVAKLIAPGGTHLDTFGAVVAISGNKALASAPEYSDLVDRRGAVYPIHLAPGFPTIRTPIFAENAENSESLGLALDLDGDTAVVGKRNVRAIDGRQVVRMYKTGPDCDSDGVVDSVQIAADPTIDCDVNGVPDACDLDPNDPDGDMFVADDCNGNGVIDSCDIDPNDPDGDTIVIPDCNTNGAPDDCDVASGDADDFNGNDIPDECECLGDLSGDGLVGLDDLAQLLADFDCALGPACLGDVDGDGDTDLADLALLLANFDRTCP